MSPEANSQLKFTLSSQAESTVAQQKWNKSLLGLNHKYLQSRGMFHNIYTLRARKTAHKLFFIMHIHSVSNHEKILKTGADWHGAEKRF